MQYPYIKYIYFLITKRLSYEELKSTLEGHGLICPSEEEIDIYIDDIVEKCPVEAFKKIINRKAKIRSVNKFLEYTKAVGVYELWLTESNAKTNRTIAPICKAKELFFDRKKSREINCFIINKLPEEDIIQAFNQRYKVAIAKSTIQAYKQYFFHTEIMDRDDWIYFLIPQPPRIKHLYLTAMNEDSNTVRHELGYKTKLEYSDALQDIFSTAYYKFREFTRRGAPTEEHEGARRWAKTVFDAGDRREKLQTGDMGEFKETLQMKFEFEESEFPGYADLQ